jgi:hypothetical protein
MKGIAGIILAATPLAAIILYFALFGQQQVRTEQVKHEAKQQVEEAKFDLEFEQMNREMSGNPMTPQEIAERQKEIDGHKQKAAAIEQRNSSLEAQSDADLKELRQAMEEHKQ